MAEETMTQQWKTQMRDHLVEAIIEPRVVVPARVPRAATSGKKERDRGREEQMAVERR